MLGPPLLRRRPPRLLAVGREEDTSSVASAQAPVRAAASPRASWAHDLEVRLLIVDDDPLMTELLPRKLSNALDPRVRIITARTVDEAAALIEGEAPHIVLSDFNLRETRTGLDVLAHAARAAPLSARILFSGHTRSEIGGSLDAADIHAYIEKPMRLDELVACVVEALRTASGVDLARRSHGAA